MPNPVKKISWPFHLIRFLFIINDLRKIDYFGPPFFGLSLKGRLFKEMNITVYDTPGHSGKIQ